MVSHFQSLLQNPIFDALYCDEQERFDEDLGGGFGLKDPEFEDFNEIQKKPFDFLSEHDLLWDDDEVETLISNEKKQAHLSCDGIKFSDGFLKVVRNEAIKWMFKVVGHYGFRALTGVLSVNYYDRFITSVCFQKDKPWMSQLAAVACLSIAAKVEETQVPLLIDLQVQESKYVFEAKTIQRMELLVLSTLQWKMNPVTPIAFIDHIVRRYELLSNLHYGFFSRCESILLSVFADCRLVNYLPSVIAAATMNYVIREIKPCDAIGYQNQLLSVLKTTKEKIDDCYKLIKEVMDDKSHKLCNKRKAMPGSPSGVIDAYFSSDSSNESWAVGSSMSSSPEPLSKRSRGQGHG